MYQVPCKVIWGDLLAKKSGSVSGSGSGSVVRTSDHASFEVDADTPSADAGNLRVERRKSNDTSDSSPAVPLLPGPEGKVDDFQSYLNRLTRYNLLTPEEEIRLANRIAAGGAAGTAAKARLVESNMRLVISVAKAYRSSGIPFEDLIQEGAIGLIKAAERFDTKRGYRFSTFAIQWIRQAIGRAVDNKAKSIRLPAHVSESLRRLDKARAEMRRELGEDPTTEQLAQYTGIAVRKVESFLKIAQDPISLDLPVGDAENISFGSLLYDDTSPDPQEELISTETRNKIQSLFSVLDERERHIIRRRLGFEGEDTHALQQIGEELSISRERVRQIEAQALRKLRSAARKRRLGDYLQGLDPQVRTSVSNHSSKPQLASDFGVSQM
jgi:RNA polymerase primary sigma factor